MKIENALEELNPAKKGPQSVKKRDQRKKMGKCAWLSSITLKWMVPSQKKKKNTSETRGSDV